MSAWDTADSLTPRALAAEVTEPGAPGDQDERVELGQGHNGLIMLARQVRS